MGITEDGVFAQELVLQGNVVQENPLGSSQTNGFVALSNKTTNIHLY